MLVHAERILEEMAQTRSHLEAARDLRAGELVIGASDTLACYLLPPLLAAFRARYPGVELRLDNRPSPATALAVAERRVHVGVVSLPLPPDSTAGGATARRSGAVRSPGSADRRCHRPAGSPPRPPDARGGPRPAGLSAAAPRPDHRQPGLPRAGVLPAPERAPPRHGDEQRGGAQTSGRARLWRLGCARVGHRPRDRGRIARRPSLAWSAGRAGRRPGHARDGSPTPGHRSLPGAGAGPAHAAPASSDSCASIRKTSPDSNPALTWRRMPPIDHMEA